MDEDVTERKEGPATDWDQIYEHSARRAFVIKAREPWVWEKQALTLKRASEIVHDCAAAAGTRNRRRLADTMVDSPTPGTSTSRYMTDEEIADDLDESLSYTAEMLLGLSLENLLKGILLHQNPNLLTKEGELKTKSHDLHKMWIQAGLDLDEERIALLRMLTKAVEWSGKYFVPLTEKQYLKDADMCISRKNTEVAWFEDFYQQALELWEFCHSQYKT